MQKKFCYKVKEGEIRLFDCKNRKAIGSLPGDLPKYDFDVHLDPDGSVRVPWKGDGDGKVPITPVPVIAEPEPRPHTEMIAAAISAPTDIPRLDLSSWADRDLSGRPIVTTSAHGGTGSVHGTVKEGLYTPVTARPTVEGSAKKLNSLTFKGNAVIGGIDLANFLYDHRDEISDVSDVADLLVDYGYEVADETVEYAKQVFNDIVSANFDSLVIDAVSLVPVMPIAKATDNILEAIGVESDISGTVEDAIEEAPEMVKEVASNPKDLTPTGAVVRGVQTLANIGGSLWSWLTG